MKIQIESKISSHTCSSLLFERGHRGRIDHGAAHAERLHLLLPCRPFPNPLELAFSFATRTPSPSARCRRAPSSMMSPRATTGIPPRPPWPPPAPPRRAIDRARPALHQPPNPLALVPTKLPGPAITSTPRRNAAAAAQHRRRPPPAVEPPPQTTSSRSKATYRSAPISSRSSTSPSPPASPPMAGIAVPPSPLLQNRNQGPCATIEISSGAYLHNRRLI